MGRYRTFETEKDEKSYEARIWWVFWCVAIVVIGYTLWHQLLQFDLIHNGQCIEAEYFVYNGQELAKYRDENNRYHTFYLEGYDAVHEDDTIKLYYKDIIDHAQPRRSPKTWFFSYAVFGTLFIACSVILRKIYTRSSYK